MIHYRNGRPKPQDPGNGVQGFQGRQNTRPYDPRKERWGRRVARYTYRVAWVAHGYFALGMLLHSLGAEPLPHAGSVLVLALPVVLAGRLIANGLTRHDEDFSYKAVKVYFSGLLVYLVLGIAGAVVNLFFVA